MLDRCLTLVGYKMGYKWTKPFYGVEHYVDKNKSIINSYWSTVNNHQTFCEVLLWFPKCGFSPKSVIAVNYDEAKTIAENWIKECYESRN